MKTIILTAALLGAVTVAQAGEFVSVANPATVKFPAGASSAAKAAHFGVLKAAIANPARINADPSAAVRFELVRDADHQND